MVKRLVPVLRRFLALAFAVSSLAHAPGEGLSVDFREARGEVRALHGINKGPIAAGGTIDLTDAHRALGIPSIRLHDCQWPYPDVVDFHAVFPNPDADPARPESYEFRLTDEYLAAVLKTGARPIYRLGESIEHGAVKRYVHPPRDPDRWAAACLGIIRHYNDGWANGFRHGIQYWEIWNEPENRPAMWTGTDREFFDLYAAASRALKSGFPSLKIGGPAVGHSGKFVDGQFVPGEFVTNFLALCRRENLPLDFFSWHCYTADVGELAARAHAVRALLDRSGFAKTESHLNEWNYLPGNTWSPLGKSAAPEARARFYGDMAGAPGAAFVAAALIELQDAPVDMANLFHGELGGFGLFSEHAVPAPNWHAIRAFNELVVLRRRARTTGQIPGRRAALAAIDPQKKRAAILISHLAANSETVPVTLANPHAAAGHFKIERLSALHPWTVAQQGEFRGDLKLSLPLEPSSVTLIQLTYRE